MNNKILLHKYGLIILLGFFLWMNSFAEDIVKRNNDLSSKYWLDSIIIKAPFSSFGLIKTGKQETIAEKLFNFEKALNKQHPNIKIQILVTPQVATKIVKGICDENVKRDKPVEVTLDEAIKMFCSAYRLSFKRENQRIIFHSIPKEFQQDDDDKKIEQEKEKLRINLDVPMQKPYNKAYAIKKAALKMRKEGWKISDHKYEVTVEEKGNEWIIKFVGKMPRAPGDEVWVHISKKNGKVTKYITGE